MGVKQWISEDRAMNIGDKMIVISDPTPHRKRGLIEQMDQYCGKIVTIRRVYSAYRTASIEEDNGLYIWAYEWPKEIRQRTE